MTDNNANAGPNSNSNGTAADNNSNTNAADVNSDDSNNRPQQQQQQHATSLPLKLSIQNDEQQASTKPPLTDSQYTNKYNNNNDNSRYSISKQQQKPNHTPASGTKKKKKKRRDKSDLGDDFVAPDGGWGWLVSIASGLNTLVTFAIGQNFGIIFRDHMARLGMSNSELTSIINMQIAISAFTGLLNGPLFRRFSYRQVAIFGAVLTFLGIFMIAFANSFTAYVVGFSCVYGFGRGLLVSASSLAVNTYFKVKRRTATAYQFGVAGLGPIILPYIATFLLQYYGVQGTVLLFSGMAMNTVPFSIIYQPVKWHTKKLEKDAEALKQPLAQHEHDEMEHVVEPDTPTLPRANDGWYGSRVSLNSMRNRLGTWERQKLAAGQELKRLNSKDGSAATKPRTFSTSHSIKEEADDDDHEHAQLQLQSHDADHHAHLQAKAELAEHEAEEERRKKLPFYKKIVIFFDLDLLRDITYLNLAFGLTLINFVEINFAILTPFILNDFKFPNNQIAMVMSILGFCDLVIRFLVPVITAKMNFSNRTFFIIGITGMCIGRAVLAYCRDFKLLVAIFIWLGLNKAFRTVFWSLIIPSYVPLKRLPAAAGLQLLMSGTFSMACGPLIGLIRDATNYSFTLQFLNSLCLLAISLWLLESFIRSRQTKTPPNELEMK